MLAAAALMSVLFCPGVAESESTGTDPGPAQGAASTKVKSDFNGDGVGDLAIGAPRGTVGGHQDAGIVYVLYAGDTGLAKAGRQKWTQDTPGVVDAAEADDQFGFVLAAGDFNTDGFSDLAIGVPLETVDNVVRSGAVHVLYGSKSGLTSAGSELLTRDTVGGGVADLDEFGTSLAAGDFGRGPADDLAVSVPIRGAVHVLYGDADGLSGAGSQVWSRDSPGIPGSAVPDELFGKTLSAGDLGRSGQADLVISAPYAEVDRVTDAGAVTVIYGSGAGLQAQGSQVWSRSSPGVRGVARARDLFGDALAIGDFGKSRFGDVAIGVASDHLDGRQNAGGVHVLYGSAQGLTSAGSQVWSQRSPGVRGTAERDDHFAYTLAAGDFGRSDRSDLAVGVPGENRGAGAINVLFGGGSGLTSAGDQMLSQNTRGMPGVAERRDGFGYPLGTADAGRGSRAELVIGVAFENPAPGFDSHRGLVHVVYGSKGGLRPRGSQIFTQHRIDRNSVVQRGAEFGRALSGQ